MNISFVTFLLLFLFVFNCSAGDWKAQIISPLNGGSIVVHDPQGKVIFSKNADKLMVPASILKIATSDAVLTTLGTHYTIKTEFYLTDDNYLGVKGFGDPTLTSESFSAIAKQLRKHLSKDGITHLKGFWLDTDYFKDQLKVHGQSNSNNPYDASVGALVANFNTVNIYKSKNGKVSSAEKQTPLTSTAIKLSKKLHPGKHRINLGKDKQLTLNYFTELLQWFLKQEGIGISNQIINTTIPEKSLKLLSHQSKPVFEIIKDLLQYSNNFTANQLLIILGGEEKGTPADIKKGRKVLVDFLNDKVAISHFTLEEGSGLSRKNQFTANQMMKILTHFKHHQTLLRIDRSHFQAKTGTLKGISTYAGYMISPSGENYPFVIMMNKTKWGSERNKVANIMYNGIFH